MDLKVLGIAGVAKVGKDTFCAHVIKLLEEKGFKSKRLAFADELKNDLKDFLLAKTGVNVYTTDPVSKESIRPLMVEYGKLMREMTKGKYWVNKVKQEVENNFKNKFISIISDVRYPNEASWINSIDGGITIHLTRNGILPANTEEAEQDPLVQKESKLLLNWPNLSEKLIQHQSLEHLNEITQNLSENRPRTSSLSSRKSKQRASTKRANI